VCPLGGSRPCVSSEVTNEVTNEVTSEVTSELTNEVTNEVTSELTNEVTSELTNEVTSEVTSELTNGLTVYTHVCGTEGDSLSRDPCVSLPGRVGDRIPGHQQRALTVEGGQVQTMSEST